MKTIVLGPPGTGKTTTLLNKVDDYLKHTDPDKVGYFAFTQKAAYEARERAVKIFNLEESNVNFSNLVNEIVKKVEIMLIKSNKGLKMIEPWSLRKETLIILNIAKRLCYLLRINDVLRKNVKLSRIDLIFCFIKGIIT